MSQHPNSSAHFAQEEIIAAAMRGPLPPRNDEAQGRILGEDATPTPKRQPARDDFEDFPENDQIKMQLGALSTVSVDSKQFRLSLRCYVREDGDDLYLAFLSRGSSLQVKAGGKLAIGIGNRPPADFVGTGLTMPLTNPAGTLVLLRKSKTKAKTDIPERDLADLGGRLAR